MEKILYSEIRYLLFRIEKEYGESPKTPRDFEMLSGDIQDKVMAVISASTLKRLWGYVQYESSPRISTLDLLAKYIGFKDFKDFRTKTGDLENAPSAFIGVDFIESDDLRKGEKIRIAWNPGRVVDLEFLGERKFKVLASENSKLRKGDTFYAERFLKGSPLYIPGIEREGITTPLYVAGMQDGLSGVTKLEKD